MAPSVLRPTFLLCVPTVAVILSILWFRRKRCALRSDPGGTKYNSEMGDSKDIKVADQKCEQFVRSSLESSVKDENGSGNNSRREENQSLQQCGAANNTNEVSTYYSNYNSVFEPQLKSASGIASMALNKGSLAENNPIPPKRDSETSVTPKIKANMEEIVEKLEVSISEYGKETEENPSIPVEFCEKILASETSAQALNFEIKLKSSEKVCTEIPEVMVKKIKSDNHNKVLISRDHLGENTSLSGFDHEESFNPGDCDSLRRESDSSMDDTLSSSNNYMKEEKNDTVCDTVSNRKIIENSGSCAVIENVSDLESANVISRTIDENHKGMEDAAQQSISCTNGLRDGPEECSDNNDASLTAGAERDSANHSPADVMLASPSMSNCSDVHSEGSSDSGKGCSYVATPPSRTPASCSSLSGDLSTHSVYEFVLPQQLVGRLIGRHGCFVHQIKAKTHAHILIKRHPDTPKLKICAVEGTQMDIENALEMIREKFPAKRYPGVTLEQVCFLPPVPTVALIPEYLQLQLVEGVNNDVILSSLVSPAHFFLQQPTHPTFPALNQLSACMNMSYNEPGAPLLPSIEVGIICAAPTMGGWYRAQVVGVDTDNETCDVKFIDYGGYLTLPNSELRQIRSDFMTLPFQAAECYLAHVIPAGGTSCPWSAEAVAYVESLTRGQVIQAQVCGYAEDGIPVVYLFTTHGTRVVPIHQELVAQGLAEWWESES